MNHPPHPTPDRIAAGLLMAASCAVLVLGTLYALLVLLVRIAP